MAKSQLKRNTEESSDTMSTTEPSINSNISVLPLKLIEPEMSSGDLGTLQEILFGKQMTTYSNQLSSLHNHVESQIDKLQENCDRQYADLHVKIDEGLSKINMTIERNNKKSIASLTKASDDLETTASMVMEQLKQDSENHSSIQDQLKSQLVDTSQLLTSSIKESQDDIIQRLETAVAQLNSQKLDKGALSSLLGDVATQLTVKEKQ